jgi:hypothetical protein
VPRPVEADEQGAEELAGVAGGVGAPVEPEPRKAPFRITFATAGGTSSVAPTSGIMRSASGRSRSSASMGSLSRVRPTVPPSARARAGSVSVETTAEIGMYSPPEWT